MALGPAAGDPQARSAIEGGRLIRALAEYEKLSHVVVGSEERLRQELFGAQPVIECFLAKEGERALGFDGTPDEHARVLTLRIVDAREIGAAGDTRPLQPLFIF
jgi:hypothetical protein